MALTEEQKQKRRDNLAKARAARGKNRAAAALSGPALEGAHTGAAEEAFPTVDAGEFLDYLAALDAETKDILNEEELRAIFMARTKRANDDLRQIKLREATAKAEQHARKNAGLLTKKEVDAAALAERMAEKVKFVVDLPTFGNGGVADAGLRIDGRLYRHGETVICTRAQFMSMREMIYRAQQAELEFEGKGRGHYLRQRAASLDVQLA